MDYAERMIELLRYANRAEVGRALGVSTQTANQWAKGRDVNAMRLRQVENLLRPDLAAQPVDNAELLREMQAIRRLLQRQAKPQPAISLDQFVTAIGDVVEQKLAAGRGSGSRSPDAGAARRRKAADRVEAGR